MYLFNESTRHCLCAFSGACVHFLCLNIVFWGGPFFFFFFSEGLSYILKPEYCIYFQKRALKMTWLDLSQGWKKRRNTEEILSTSWNQQRRMRRKKLWKTKILKVTLWNLQLQRRKTKRKVKRKSYERQVAILQYIQWNPPSKKLMGLKTEVSLQMLLAEHLRNAMSGSLKRGFHCSHEYVLVWKSYIYYYV